MLPILVHFLFCICTRNSHRSLSLAASVCLLSMIAHTVSDSSFSGTDLITSVTAQQLGNVSSNNFLIESNSFYPSATKKFKSTAIEHSLSNIEALFSETKKFSQLVTEIPVATGLQSSPSSSADILNLKATHMFNLNSQSFSLKIMPLSSSFNDGQTSQSPTKPQDDIITNVYLPLFSSFNKESVSTTSFSDDMTTEISTSFTSLASQTMNLMFSSKTPAFSLNEDLVPDVHTSSTINTFVSDILITPLSKTFFDDLSKSQNSQTSDIKTIPEIEISADTSHPVLNFKKTIDSGIQSVTQLPKEELSTDTVDESVKDTSISDTGTAKRSLLSTSSSITGELKDSFTFTESLLYGQSKLNSLPIENLSTDEKVPSSLYEALNPQPSLSDLLSTGTLMNSESQKSLKPSPNHISSPELQPSFTDIWSSQSQNSFLSTETLFTDTPKLSSSSSAVFDTVASKMSSLTMNTFSETTIQDLDAKDFQQNLMTSYVRPHFTDTSFMSINTDMLNTESLFLSPSSGPISELPSSYKRTERLALSPAFSSNASIDISVISTSEVSVLLLPSLLTVKLSSVDEMVLSTSAEILKSESQYSSTFLTASSATEKGSLSFTKVMTLELQDLFGTYDKTRIWTSITKVPTIEQGHSNDHVQTLLKDIHGLSTPLTKHKVTEQEQSTASEGTLLTDVNQLLSSFSELKDSGKMKFGQTTPKRNQYKTSPATLLTDINELTPTFTGRQNSEQTQQKTSSSTSITDINEHSPSFTEQQISELKQHKTFSDTLVMYINELSPIFTGQHNFEQSQNITSSATLTSDINDLSLSFTEQQNSEQSQDEAASSTLITDINDLSPPFTEQQSSEQSQDEASSSTLITHINEISPSFTEQQNSEQSQHRTSSATLITDINKLSPSFTGKQNSEQSRYEVSSATLITDINEFSGTFNGRQNFERRLHVASLAILITDINDLSPSFTEQQNSEQSQDEASSAILITDINEISPSFTRQQNSEQSQHITFSSTLMTDMNEISPSFAGQQDFEQSQHITSSSTLMTDINEISPSFTGQQNSEQSQHITSSSTLIIDINELSPTFTGNQNSEQSRHEASSATLITDINELPDTLTGQQHSEQRLHEASSATLITDINYLSPSFREQQNSEQSQDEASSSTLITDINKISQSFTEQQNSKQCQHITSSATVITDINELSPTFTGKQNSEQGLREVSSAKLITDINELSDTLTVQQNSEQNQYITSSAAVITDINELSPTFTGKQNSEQGLHEVSSAKLITDINELSDTLTGQQNSEQSQYITSSATVITDIHELSPTFTGKQNSEQSRHEVSSAKLITDINELSDTLTGQQNSEQSQYMTSSATVITDINELSPTFTGKQYSEQSRHEVSPAKLITDINELSDTLTGQQNSEQSQHITSSAAVITDINELSPTFTGKQISEQSRHEVSSAKLITDINELSDTLTGQQNSEQSQYITSSATVITDINELSTTFTGEQNSEQSRHEELSATLITEISELSDTLTGQQNSEQRLHVTSSATLITEINYLSSLFKEHNSEQSQNETSSATLIHVTDINKISPSFTGHQNSKQSQHITSSATLTTDINELSSKVTGQQLSEQSQHRTSSATYDELLPSFTGLEISEQYKTFSEKQKTDINELSESFMKLKILKQTQLYVSSVNINELSPSFSRPVFSEYNQHKPKSQEELTKRKNDTLSSFTGIEISERSQHKASSIEIEKDISNLSPSYHLLNVSGQHQTSSSTSTTVISELSSSFTGLNILKQSQHKIYSEEFTTGIRNLASSYHGLKISEPHQTFSSTLTTEISELSPTFTGLDISKQRKTSSKELTKTISEHLLSFTINRISNESHQETSSETLTLKVHVLPSTFVRLNISETPQTSTEPLTRAIDEFSPSFNALLISEQHRTSSSTLITERRDFSSTFAAQKISEKGLHKTSSEEFTTHISELPTSTGLKISEEHRKSSEEMTIDISGLSLQFGELQISEHKTPSSILTTEISRYLPSFTGLEISEQYKTSSEELITEISELSPSLTELKISDHKTPLSLLTTEVSVHLPLFTELNISEQGRHKTSPSILATSSRTVASELSEFSLLFSRQHNTHSRTLATVITEVPPSFTELDISKQHKISSSTLAAEKSKLSPSFTGLKNSEQHEIYSEKVTPEISELTPSFTALNISEQLVTSSSTVSTKISKLSRLNTGLDISEQQLTTRIHELSTIFTGRNISEQHKTLSETNAADLSEISPSFHFISEQQTLSSRTSPRKITFLPSFTRLEISEQQKISSETTDKSEVSLSFTGLMTSEHSQPATFPETLTEDTSEFAIIASKSQEQYMTSTELLTSANAKLLLSLPGQEISEHHKKNSEELKIEIFDLSPPFTGPKISEQKQHKTSLEPLTTYENELSPSFTSFEISHETLTNEINELPSSFNWLKTSQQSKQTTFPKKLTTKTSDFAFIRLKSPEQYMTSSELLSTDTSELKISGQQNTPSVTLTNEISELSELHEEFSSVITTEIIHLSQLFTGNISEQYETYSEKWTAEVSDQSLLFTKLNTSIQHITSSSTLPKEILSPPFTGLKVSGQYETSSETVTAEISEQSPLLAKLDTSIQHTTSSSTLPKEIVVLSPSFTGLLKVSGQYETSSETVTAEISEQSSLFTELDTSIQHITYPSTLQKEIAVLSPSFTGLLKVSGQYETSSETVTAALSAISPTFTELNTSDQHTTSSNTLPSEIGELSPTFTGLKVSGQCKTSSETVTVAALSAISPSFSELHTSEQHITSSNTLPNETAGLAPSFTGLKVSGHYETSSGTVTAAALSAISPSFSELNTSAKHSISSNTSPNVIGGLSPTFTGLNVSGQYETSSEKVIAASLNVIYPSFSELNTSEQHITSSNTLPNELAGLSPTFTGLKVSGQYETSTETVTAAVSTISPSFTELNTSEQQITSSNTLPNEIAGLSPSFTGLEVSGQYETSSGTATAAALSAISPSFSELNTSEQHITSSNTLPNEIAGLSPLFTGLEVSVQYETSSETATAAALSAMSPSFSEPNTSEQHITSSNTLPNEIAGLSPTFTGLKVSGQYETSTETVTAAVSTISPSFTELNTSEQQISSSNTLPNEIAGLSPSFTGLEVSGQYETSSGTATAAALSAISPSFSELNTSEQHITSSNTLPNEIAGLSPSFTGLEVSGQYETSSGTATAAALSAISPSLSEPNTSEQHITSSNTLPNEIAGLSPTFTGLKVSGQYETSSETVTAAAISAISPSFAELNTSEQHITSSNISPNEVAGLSPTFTGLKVSGQYKTSSEKVTASALNVILPSFSEPNTSEQHITSSNTLPNEIAGLSPTFTGLEVSGQYETETSSETVTAAALSVISPSFSELNTSDQHITSSNTLPNEIGVISRLFTRLEISKQHENSSETVAAELSAIPPLFTEQLKTSEQHIASSNTLPTERIVLSPTFTGLESSEQEKTYPEVLIKDISELSPSFFGLNASKQSQHATISDTMAAEKSELSFTRSNLLVQYMTSTSTELLTTAVSKLSLPVTGQDISKHHKTSSEELTTEIIDLWPAHTGLKVSEQRKYKTSSNPDKNELSLSFTNFQILNQSQRKTSSEILTEKSELFSSFSELKISGQNNSPSNTMTAKIRDHSPVFAGFDDSERHKIHSSTLITEINEHMPTFTGLKILEQHETSSRTVTSERNEILPSFTRLKISEQKQNGTSLETFTADVSELPSTEILELLSSYSDILSSVMTSKFVSQTTPPSADLSLNSISPSKTSVETFSGNKPQTSSSIITSVNGSLIPDIRQNSSFYELLASESSVLSNTLSSLTKMPEVPYTETLISSPSSLPSYPKNQVPITETINISQLFKGTLSVYHTSSDVLSTLKPNLNTTETYPYLILFSDEITSKTHKIPLPSETNLIESVSHNSSFTGTLKSANCNLIASSVKMWSTSTTSIQSTVTETLEYLPEKLFTNTLSLKTSLLTSLETLFIKEISSSPSLTEVSTFATYESTLSEAANIGTKSLQPSLNRLFSTEKFNKSPLQESHFSAGTKQLSTVKETKDNSLIPSHIRISSALTSFNEMSRTDIAVSQLSLHTENVLIDITPLSSSSKDVHISETLTLSTLLTGTLSTSMTMVTHLPLPTEASITEIVSYSEIIDVSSFSNNIFSTITPSLASSYAQLTDLETSLVHSLSTDIFINKSTIQSSSTLKNLTSGNSSKPLLSLVRTFEELHVCPSSTEELMFDSSRSFSESSLLNFSKLSATWLSPEMHSSSYNTDTLTSKKPHESPSLSQSLQDVSSPLPPISTRALKTLNIPSLQSDILSSLSTETLHLQSPFNQASDLEEINGPVSSLPSATSTAHTETEYPKLSWTDILSSEAMQRRLTTTVSKSHTGTVLPSTAAYLTKFSTSIDIHPTPTLKTSSIAPSSTEVFKISTDRIKVETLTSNLFPRLEPSSKYSISPDIMTSTEISTLNLDKMAIKKMSIDAESVQLSSILMSVHAARSFTDPLASSVTTATTTNVYFIEIETSELSTHAKTLSSLSTSCSSPISSSTDEIYAFFSSKESLSKSKTHLFGTLSILRSSFISTTDTTPLSLPTRYIFSFDSSAAKQSSGTASAPSLTTIDGPLFTNSSPTMSDTGTMLLTPASAIPVPTLLMSTALSTPVFDDSPFLSSSDHLQRTLSPFLFPSREIKDKFSYNVSLLQDAITPTSSKPVLAQVSSFTTLNELPPQMTSFTEEKKSFASTGKAQSLSMVITEIPSKMSAKSTTSLSLSSSKQTKPSEAVETETLVTVTIPVSANIGIVPAVSMTTFLSQKKGSTMFGSIPPASSYSEKETSSATSLLKISLSPLAHLSTTDSSSSVLSNLTLSSVQSSTVNTSAEISTRILFPSMDDMSSSSPASLMKTATLERHVSSLTERWQISSTVEGGIITKRPLSTKGTTLPSSKVVALPPPAFETTLLSSFRSQQYFKTHTGETVSAYVTENLQSESVTSFSSMVSKSSMKSRLPPVSTHKHTASTLSVTLSSIPSSTLTSSGTTSPPKIGPQTLLTIGIIVKRTVDIKSNAVNVRIKEGLKRCYNEGVAKAAESSYRKKRADSNVTAEVMSIKRKDTSPTHVDVDFYVLVDGIVQPSTKVLAIFSRLTVAETSAYLSYPMITPVKLVSNPTVKQKPADGDESQISVSTLFFIGTPPVCAVVATVILIILYCRKTDRTLEKVGSNLEDADLKIDIEKGEVVSASANRNINLPQFTFDHGKGDLNSVWKHMTPTLHKSHEFHISEIPFKRSVSENCSATRRLERLRKLGFHVSEIRKSEKQTKETFTDAHVIPRSDHEDNSDTYNEFSVMNNLDKPTNQSHVFCQAELKSEPRANSNTKETRNKSSAYHNDVLHDVNMLVAKNRDNRPSPLRFDANIKPAHQSLSNISKIIDSLAYHSSHSDKESGQNVESNRSVRFKDGCPHRRKKKLKRRKKEKHYYCASSKSRELKNNLNESIRNETQLFRPRVPSIPVEGYCNKIMYEPFYFSLTLSKNPEPVNNFIEGDLEDEVFLTNNIPLPDLSEKHNHASESNTISAFQEKNPNFAAKETKQKHIKQKTKYKYSGNKKSINSRHKCDIIRTCDVNSVGSVGVQNYNLDHFQQQTSSDVRKSLLRNYLRHWSDDPFYLKTCCDNFTDGSEYAGHEFESLNFNREYTGTERDQPSGGLHLSEDTSQDSNMAEGVVGPFPGVYEHVTKMGRVGKGHQDSSSGKNNGPQFRKLPFQDQTIVIPAPKRSTPVPSISPRESDKVIMRDELVDDSFRDVPDLNISIAPERPKSKPAPYVEMKLGRNMRAAPKGTIASRIPASDVNPQLDATEPLLHNHSLSSNDIAEYYANTHSALRPQTQGSGIASRQYPARSITSPQHPSQDLIETLNRNNLTSLTQETRLVEDEQRKAAERQEQLEDERKQREEEETKVKFVQERQAQQDRETKDLLLNDSFALTSQPAIVTTAADITSPPLPVDLYGSYRMKENYFVEPKSSEQVSTQPFTPQNSTVFSQNGETTETTTSLRGTNSGFTVPKSVSVEKQETVDDVEDIEEDIHVEGNDSDDGKISDEDFNF